MGRRCDVTLTELEEMDAHDFRGLEPLAELCCDVLKGNKRRQTPTSNLSARTTFAEFRKAANPLVVLAMANEILALRSNPGEGSHHGQHRSDGS